MRTDTLHKRLEHLLLPIRLDEYLAAQIKAPYPRTKLWQRWEAEGLVDSDGLTAKGKAVLECWLELANLLDVVLV